MKRVLASIWVGVFLGIISYAYPTDLGTADEAEAMVKKAVVADPKPNGENTGFEEICNPKEQFVDRK